jgi:hypothetical protein
MRFTLNKLFIAVALLAIACSGMFYRTSLWADSIFTLTVALLIGVLLWAMGQSGRQRAAGLGGGVVALGYLLLLTSTQFQGIRESLLTNYPIAWAARALPAEGPSAPPYLEPITASPPPSFVCGGIVVAPDPAIDGSEIAPSETSSEEASVEAATPIADPFLGAQTTPPPSVAVLAPNVPQYTIKTLINYGLSFGNEGMPISNFFLIGHCVWSWLLAVLGAWFAGRMYDRRERAARAAG